MRSNSILALSVLFVAATKAWDNTPPIPERVEGLGEGSGNLRIDFEVHYDLMCSASAALYPDFATFLDTPFLNGKVRDAVTVRYVFQPLTYHHATWVPHKLLPLIIDQCVANSTSCQYINYMNFCFNNQDDILGSTDLSYNQIVQNWTAKVAKQFGWNQKDLTDLFDYDTDTHNSEMRTRYMWKYSTSRGVTSTPSTFVNGIMVQNYPGSPDDWMQLLKDTYAGQQNGASVRPHQFLQ